MTLQTLQFCVILQKKKNTRLHGVHVSLKLVQHATCDRLLDNLGMASVNCYPATVQVLILGTIQAREALSAKATDQTATSTFCQQNERERERVTSSSAMFLH